MPRKNLVFTVVGLFGLAALLWVGIGAGRLIGYEAVDAWDEQSPQAEHEDPLIQEYEEKIALVESSIEAVEQADSTEAEIDALKELTLNLAELRLDELIERKEDLQLPVYYEPETTDPQQEEHESEPEATESEYDDWDYEEW